MAVQAWKWYNLAIKKIGLNTLAMNGTVFRLSLVQSTSNFATRTLGVWNSVTNEVASAAGYSSSGKALTGEVWTVGGSAKQYKFDTDDWFVSANGVTISNIKGAVVWVSAAASANRHLVCFASLTSTQFNLAAGNRLTLQMNASGVLTITAA